MTQKNAILLGIDPGFASFGFAAIALPPDPMNTMMRIESFGVFETAKATKKQHVLATEDNLRRARELADFLDALIVRHATDRGRLVAICAESMSWPRNAAVTAKMGITWGVVAAVAHRHKLPILQASPQAVKKGTAGRRDATKDDVEAAVLKRITRANPDLLGTHVFADVAKRIPKTKKEHPFDAAAVAIVCSGAEIVQLSRRAAA